MIQFQVRISGKKMEKLRMEIDQLRREDVTELEVAFANEMENVVAGLVKAVGKKAGVMVDMKMVPNLIDRQQGRVVHPAPPTEPPNVPAPEPPQGTGKRS